MKRFSQLKEDISYRNKSPIKNVPSPKAIFVTGGPGSGKDIIVRESVVEYFATELNLIQAMDCLNNKHTLSETTQDARSRSIYSRNNLIINGPADDLTRITTIKEELEELGYVTQMVFVATTNDVSRQRNATLRRMMNEDIRQDKWNKSQNNGQVFSEMFSQFDIIDNSKDLNNRFTALYEANSKSIQKANLTAKGCGRHGKLLFDDSCPFCQDQDTKGKIDDIKYNDANPHKDFIYGRYSESKEPTLIVRKQPAISRFNMDKDRASVIKRGDKSLAAPRAARPDGVSSTYNSRMGGGSSAAGAGLGNQTYAESRSGTTDYNDDVCDFCAKSDNVNPNPLGEKKSAKQPKTLKKFREAIDSPSCDMGVGGVLGGGMNKEPMVTPMDKYGQSGITIKKKKQEQK